MKKKIKLIVTSNNINKNKKGSIVSVSRGYAFNYLIPRKEAEIATNQKIKHITMFEEIKKKKYEINETKIKTLRKKIDKIQKISLYKKTGDNYFIFGSVAEKDVTKWISQHTYIKLNKIQVKIPDIKTIGIMNAEIELKQDMNENIQVNVLPVNI